MPWRFGPGRIPLTGYDDVPDAIENGVPEDPILIINSDIANNAEIALDKLQTVTPSGVFVSDINGHPIVHETVTAIELGHLNNVSSNVQTQLDSKLSNTVSPGGIYIGNGSSVATVQFISGDATVSAGGVLQIAPGSVINSDIADNAAIELTKLQTLTPNRIVGTTVSGHLTTTDLSIDTFTGTIDGQLFMSDGGSTHWARPVIDSNATILFSSTGQMLFTST
jgi:hypothetical protein